MDSNAVVTCAVKGHAENIRLTETTEYSTERSNLVDSSVPIRCIRPLTDLEIISKKSFYFEREKSQMRAGVNNLG